MEGTMRRLWGVLLSAAFVIGTLQAVPAQESIKIGVVGPHSGPAAYDGQSTLIGAQVAADEINAAGGLLGGRKIEIVPADSRGIPAESVSAYRKVVTQDKVVAVDCCWFSSSTIATHPTIEELKIPTTTGVAFLPDAKETKLTYLFKFAQTPRLGRADHRRVHPAGRKSLGRNPARRPLRRHARHPTQQGVRERVQGEAERRGAGSVRAGRLRQHLSAR